MPGTRGPRDIWGFHFVCRSHVEESLPPGCGMTAVLSASMWEASEPSGLAVVLTGHGGKNGAAATLGSKASCARGVSSPDLSPGAFPINGWTVPSKSVKSQSPGLCPTWSYHSGKLPAREGVQVNSGTSLPASGLRLLALEAKTPGALIWEDILTQLCHSWDPSA